MVSKTHPKYCLFNIFTYNICVFYTHYTIYTIYHLDAAVGLSTHTVLLSLALEFLAFGAYWALSNNSR
jgi:hypothetical protein